MTELADKT